jgi:hypothetical protein
VLATLATAALLAACGGGSGGSSPTPSIGTPPAAGSAGLWILQGPGLEAQAMATSPEGISFFSNPSRTVLYPAIANVPAPSAWHTILWNKYASYADFSAAVASNSVPPGTLIVGYDDEDWQYTPANEQLDPVGYTIKFAQLAHAHGFKVIAMPAEDLMNNLSGDSDKFAAFISFGMARAVAPYVDYYHIQAQDLEGNPPAFAAYVQTIGQQVHAANPAVTLTAGISTNPADATGGAVAGDMDAAISASQSFVSGYWINIVGNTTATAVAALENAP